MLSFSVLVSPVKLLWNNAHWEKRYINTIKLNIYKINTKYRFGTREGE